jgi:hypothetical protein
VDRAHVVDRSGEKLGGLEEVYLAADTGQPQWAAIKTGLLGTKLSTRIRRRIVTEHLSESGEVIRREPQIEEDRPGPEGG